MCLHGGRGIRTICYLTEAVTPLDKLRDHDKYKDDECGYYTATGLQTYAKVSVPIALPYSDPPNYRNLQEKGVTISLEGTSSGRRTQRSARKGRASASRKAKQHSASTRSKRVEKYGSWHAANHGFPLRTVAPSAREPSKWSLKTSVRKLAKKVSTRRSKAAL